MLKCPIHFYWPFCPSSHAEEIDPMVEDPSELSGGGVVGGNCIHGRGTHDFDRNQRLVWWKNNLGHTNGLCYKNTTKESFLFYNKFLVSTKSSWCQRWLPIFSLDQACLMRREREKDRSQLLWSHCFTAAIHTYFQYIYARCNHVGAFFFNDFFFSFPLAIVQCT